ncbi:MAG: Uma2 family endonuclease [Nitrospirae bacterium]|nr:MAG: Uma2 family endonuclease [Nitrospirota bacterium]
MAIGIKQSLTYEEYAAFPSDRNRYELLDGDLLVTPVPTPQHQRASKRLQRQLEAYFEEQGLGEMFAAPIDVILSNQDVFQPDLVVARSDRIASRGIEGSPLLIVEILSSSTRERDRVLKARRYAQLGVPHYWLIDPDIPRLECFRLESGQYVLAVQAEGSATLEHPDFPSVTIRLAALVR